MYSLSFVVLSLNTLIVKWAVFGQHGVGHHLHIRLGAILVILYGLIRHLFGPKMHFSLHSNHIFNFFLLGFDPKELASVSVVDSEYIVSNFVCGSCSHVIKWAAVTFLDEFLSNTQAFLRIHLNGLKIMHLRDKGVPSLQVFDSFVCPFFLLL